MGAENIAFLGLASHTSTTRFVEPHKAICTLSQPVFCQQDKQCVTMA